jgi:hypothetical protein
MSKFLAATILAAGVVSGVSSADAATINLATGLDAAGMLQTTGGSVDANWTTSGAVNPLNPPNGDVVSTSSGDSGFPSWVPNGPNSVWIAANPNDAFGNGLVTYTRKFWVNTPSTASIVNGLWSIDDNGVLTLNGNVLSDLSATPGPWFNMFSTGSGSGDFVHGWNTLVMTTTSTDTFIEGARLEGTVVGAGVPESSIWAMMLIGFAGLGFAGVRARRAATSIV